MKIDTTYSYFTSPNFEATPTFSNHKKQAVVSKRSSRLSYPELTVLSHGATATESTAIEEWATNFTYGFFSSPSLDPEPIHSRNDNNEQISKSTIRLNRGNEQARKSPATILTQESYSFFGI